MTSLKQYDHLKLITKSLVSGQEVVWKVMWAIVNHFGRMHFDRCVQEFKKATGHNLQDHFEFEKDELRQFLLKKPGMFEVAASGEVRALDYDEHKEFSLGNQGRSKKQGDDQRHEVIALD